MEFFMEMIPPTSTHQQQGADGYGELRCHSGKPRSPAPDRPESTADICDGLAKGINKNKNVVEKAISGVAKAMELTLQTDLKLTGSAISGFGQKPGTWCRKLTVYTRLPEKDPETIYCIQDAP